VTAQFAELKAQPEYSVASQSALARKSQLFINGKWVDSTGGDTIDILDPSTARKIGEQVDATAEDIDRAVRAARIAFDDGRWTGLAPSMRERLLHRLADILERHADELGELESIDNGKPLMFAKSVDLPSGLAFLRQMAGWAPRLGGDCVDPSMHPSGAFHAYVRREPVGVVGQIVPWNFPLLMALMKIGPALAAGCTVVLKPAEQTPLTALRLADLVAESGIPDGVLNIVTGRGETAGDALVRHPLVDKIAFTGSTAVGKIINRAATDTLKRVTLELGGKSPVIIMPDVDIDSTAGSAARAIFFNSGQVCIAGSRVYAHRQVFDELLEGLATQAGEWKLGASLAEGTQMGPLVSAEQRARVGSYIEAGRKAGASVVAGGNVSGADSSYFVQPTVLANVTPDMSVVREEIFGPVVVAQRFDDLDEVVAAANDTELGLAASIWTKDLSAMHRLASRVKAGIVWGNCHALIDPALPFGGFKQSGLGREGGRSGIDAYTEEKTVIINLA
jgi:phenylacetaldehyde dehydrogenase